MFATMIKFELKNILREKITMIMVLYPVFLGIIGNLLIHYEVVYGQGLQITAIMITLLAGFAFGAMGSFSLLDDRDDQVLLSIQITPVPLEWYIWFKVCFTYVLALFAGLFLIWFTGVLELSFVKIFAVAALSALQVPFVMFIVNSFSENKVEGFMAMKALGFLLIFPVAGFFFLDAVEWVFAVAPASWPAKAMQYVMLEPLIEAGFVEMNLGFYGYVGLGFAYSIFLAGLSYILFRRKNFL